MGTPTTAAYAIAAVVAAAGFAQSGGLIPPRPDKPPSNGFAGGSQFRINVDGLRMCPKLVPGEPLWALVKLIYREKFGRRDWTRTNDPHHVKVML